MDLPFHPITARWFLERFGEPTEVQLRAWPEIAAGRHVLVTAPTGTGKTLAAFLGALDRLLVGAWPGEGLKVLYVSPLKALNNDIRRNLLVPLQELTDCFRDAGVCPQKIEVMVRSGDSPEDERRRLRRHPPEILITTPESLSILLTQSGSVPMFQNLQVVILDEIHAIVGSKRGTSLLTALERLASLAGPFQRIGLSATVNPPDLVARALGGFDGPGAPRPVTVIAQPSAKAYDVRVVLPQFQPEPSDSGKVFWESLALELRRRIGDRPSTLIFTNSRRACEKLARLMNENQDELVAYSHHGSLSKEIRLEVEERLKKKELRALVATNSLELGIDIGDLDEVILAETPRTASSAIQKVGRAGHRTGEVSRARLYPSHGLDLVEAAVLVRCIRNQTVEPLLIPEAPLDVLAQILLSMLSARPSSAEDLFAVVRRAWPYRNLDHKAFDLVMQMLDGRYAGSRIPELKPRIEVDLATGVWSAKGSVPFLLYSSGGTIPDRGYFTLRNQRTGSALGELDEEFVWERTLGDRFALGAQVWKILAIDDQAVHVEPVEAPPHIIPFWKAEDQDRGWFLAEKVGNFLEEADQALGTDPLGWQAALVSEDGFSPEAAARLVETLERERTAIGVLPHRWQMVVERVAPETPTTNTQTDADQYVVHTFWGARVNRPWAFALSQAWEDRFGFALETYPGDDQILILVPPDTALEEALSLVTPANLLDLLKRRLETTGFFGARFREGAGRALLLPKAGFGKRMPLWQTRLKAKRLFEAVSRFSDFPILIEAWRQCLHDEFDLEALQTRLDELSTGRIRTHWCRTSAPSPFTEGLLWRQVNEKMYTGDEPAAQGGSRLDQPLWDLLTGSDRPRLPRSLVADWQTRWGRTYPGYAPETPADLADFLEVRVALLATEWEALLDACSRDSGRPRDEWAGSVPVVRVAERVGIPRMAEYWSEPQPTYLRWLEGRGPVEVGTMATFWGQTPEDLTEWAQTEFQAGNLVMGLLTEEAQAVELCLVGTWDLMVRRLRLERRGSVPTHNPAELPLFLARWQGLVHPDRDPGNLEARIGPLLGLPLDAELWEAVILPCRVRPYRSADFDRLFLEEGLRWFGAGPGRIVLGFPEDLADAKPGNSLPTTEDQRDLDRVFGPSPTPSEATFTDLVEHSGLTTQALTEALWSLAWRGLASATTFGPLRHGIRTGFRYESGAEHGKAPVRGFQRWASARNASGTWHRWGQTPNKAAAKPPAGALDHLEETKRRARVVLDRYGIVFRALLAQEAPAFQWKALFPALRLMELSGEIFGGQFWDEIPGIQFATPEALRALEAGGDESALWVQHAQDPSSLCGLGLEVLGPLPRRATGVWLWWRGQTLVGSLTAQGKRYQTGTDPHEADLPALVRRTATLLLTEAQTRWVLETIDGTPATDHALVSIFIQNGFRPHGDKLILWKS